MATWNGVITNAGNSLLNEWVNEKALNFDSAAAGQGAVAVAAMMAQTALVSQKQTASLLGGEQVTGGIRLKIRIAAPTTAYTLNQFGVWASVTGGNTTMIALFQLEDGIPIPSKTESPDFVYTFYALISSSNAGTWTMTVDTSACVTQGDMTTAITQAVSTKQDKIMVKGLLMGDGAGNLSAAVAGKDYGYPLATGSGAPTATTAGTAGQHYYDSATGKEYVCKGKDSSGKYQWELSGASDASDLTYNGQKLDTFLDGVSGDLDTLSKGLDGSKPLTGKTDPTSSTKGSVGQSYLNTDTMQTFYCTAANDQTGVYTWEKPKGGGVAPQLEVSVATGSAITCTNGETTLTAPASAVNAFLISLATVHGRCMPR
nr:MAG TPA: tail-collar fiber protein [Caudoviricetes sp.]